MNNEILLAKKDRRNRFYRIYADARYRCTCKTNNSYKYYGGRGILFKWNNFEDFYFEMVKGYLEHIKKYGKNNTELDRINNDGDYSMENCRWATRKVQNNNSRHTNKVTFNGETKSITEWAEHLGLKRATLNSRINSYHFSLEKALMCIDYRK